MTATATPPATSAAKSTAHPITSDAEAIEIARALAVDFGQDAPERDRSRRLPGPEVDRLSRSGLLAISVPARFGGADVSVATLTEVFRILAAADPSIAQIPHSHFVFLDALRRQGTDEQQAYFFARVLAGERFANAQTERGGRTTTEDATTLTRRETGNFLLRGEKFYCTGALFAHWLVVRAVLADERAGADGVPRKALAYIPRGRVGVCVEDDWDAMGQRTTASGTVRLTDVLVDADEIVGFNELFAGPTTYGARAQVLHAALDAGIARGATDAMVTAVAKSRPWFESGADTASGDPLVVQQAGDLEITVRAAEALLRDAAEAVDLAERSPSPELCAAASIATAVAKVASARASLDAASTLFELGGTRAASGSANLSRYWRDARTHTLHDPARWKIQHIGRWLLTGAPPPRHGQL